jgi:hypothetical protein
MDLNTEVSQLLNEFSEEERRKQELRNKLESMTSEELMEFMKKINPYGVVSDAKVSKTEQASISYTNMRMEYMKRFVVTSMVGYMLRMLKEYKVPNEIPPVEPLEYIRNPSICDPPAFVKDPSVLAKYAEFKAGMEERVAIYKFIQSIFDFDPDRHVTSALATNVQDPSRIVPKSEAIARALAARKNTVNTLESRSAYEATIDKMTREAKTEQERYAFEMVPSLDTFIRYDRYAEEFYEQYQDLVHTIYGQRPDVDFAVIVYDKHTNSDDAKKFKERNMNKVIAPITNIDLNRWVLLGPYQENRERVDFYNSHTEVLKEMLDQRERDSKVAADIMRKRIKNEKLKNIAEAGPDAPEFRKFIKENKPNISVMGGEHVAVDNADDEDDDKNVVEVNVFTVGDGGRDLKVHKIYNPVEAPANGS